MKTSALCSYPNITVAAIFCIAIVIVSFSVKNQDAASLNHPYSHTVHSNFHHNINEYDLYLDLHQFKITETNIMKTIHLCSHTNIKTSASSDIHKCLNSSVKIKRYVS
jgi:hypothetical protein